GVAFSGEGDLVDVPLLGGAELVLACLERRSHVAILDLNLVLDGLRRYRQHSDLAIFGLCELVAVVVVVALEILVGRVGNGSGGALRNEHVAERPRLAVEIVEGGDQNVRTGSDLANRGENLPA